VNLRVMTVAVLAALVVMLVSVAAWARNPHCAGGIQYLTQALGDKQKNNTEDYLRERQKAVDQLRACASEDPSDFEGIGYLGWAYGEIDSMCAAGKSFQIAIDGLTAKGDKKKADLVTNNRESFWATAFNKGIASINSAQAAYNPYTNTPATDEDKKAKDSATKSYDEALTSLGNALCLKPGDARSLRNLGTVHALKGEYDQAQTFFQQALKAAPGDTDIVNAMHQASQGRAAQLLSTNKFDDAMKYYQDLLKTDPNNGDLWSGLADAAQHKANASDSAVKTAALLTAADAYAKAGALSANGFDLYYNAAVCYMNAGNLASSEAMWRAALKLKPDDREALMAMSITLTGEKKYADAIAAAMHAVKLDPQDKSGHHQLGNAYNAAGDNLHSKQALLVYLALDKGKPVDAPTAASGAGGTKLQASMGKPDKILVWQADNQTYETWFYWSKGLAFHFEGGAQLEKSDWSAALATK